MTASRSKQQQQKQQQQKQQKHGKGIKSMDTIPPARQHGKDQQIVQRAKDTNQEERVAATKSRARNCTLLRTRSGWIHAHERERRK